MIVDDDVTGTWQLAAADSRRWRADAEGLKQAADVLRREWLSTPRGRSGIALPALLLAGYAVECYAKARILETGASMSTWRRKGHDLPWLVNRAGVEPTDDEARVLRRMKRVVKWAGRYPAPLQPDDFMPPGQPWARQVHESDFEHVDTLCSRLAGPVP